MYPITLSTVTEGVRQMKVHSKVNTPYTHTLKNTCTLTYTRTVGSSSSNASSSDDEVKEAFEGCSYPRQSSYAPPQYPSYSWTLPKDDKADQAFMWNPDPFVAIRPVKVEPAGHKKPKFFAQMSASCSERPHLDFSKMQHSKRLIMVRLATVVTKFNTAIGLADDSDITLIYPYKFPA